MDWTELIVGTVFGTILGALLTFLGARFNTWHFTKYNLRPLIGTYKAYYKNNERALEIKEIKVLSAKNKTLIIQTENRKEICSKSEVFFESSKYGRGWYIEKEDPDSQNIEAGKTFGYREIIINAETNELLVWNSYSRDNSYGPKADYNTVNQSYVWKLIPKQK